MLKWLIYSLVLFVFISCNDDFVIETDEERLIVVDGWIDEGKHPIVILTKSSSYFSIVDSTKFREFIAFNLKVTVSDGEYSEVLTYGPLKGVFPGYGYRGTDLDFVGEAGKTYYLEVDYHEKIITSDTIIYIPKKLTAQTIIPTSPVIDSAWFEMEPPNDSLGTIKLKFTDNISEKNYYRILTKNLPDDERFYPITSSTLDDNLFDKPVNIYPLFKGKQTQIDDPSDFYYKIGDTVRIKLCTIDEASYIFWNAYQMESVNAINPFASSSSNLKGNIEGEGLGIWTGQGVSYYTLIIK